MCPYPDAEFPGAVMTPRDHENKSGISFDDTKKKVLFAEDIEKLENEIKAIQTILGINPQGGSSTVSDRIAALE